MSSFEFRQMTRLFLGAGLCVSLACTGQVTIGLGAPDAATSAAGTNSGSVATMAGAAGSTATPICQGLGQTQIPLDLVVMIDKSLTMNEATSTGETKWAALTSALTQFGEEPRSAGIGVAVGFFAIFDQPDHISCDPAIYANPAVAMGSLNGHSAAISAAMNATSFETSSSAAKTPMHIALQGAVAYAKGWAGQHRDRDVVIAFVTDGVPNACDGTFDDVVAAASDGAKATPGIKTHVLAVLDSPVTVAADGQSTTLSNQLVSLNRVAAAGLTGSAFVIDIAATKRTELQFASALTAIRQAHESDVYCGASNTAAGGSANSAGGAPQCRLIGQSCAVAADCCSANCCQGLCASTTCAD